MNSPRDDNRVPAMIGTLNSDGITPINVLVNPVNHGIKVLDGVSGSSLPFVNAQRDDNRIPTVWGVSSADGETIIPIYVDINGNLLIKST